MKSFQTAKDPEVELFCNFIVYALNPFNLFPPVFFQLMLAVLIPYRHMYVSSSKLLLEVT